MNKLNIYDDTTPLSMLTVGQLREIIDTHGSNEPKARGGRTMVFGIAGIRQIFHCGETRAYELKNTVIKDAVSQHGRTIAVDVEKALALFEASGKRK